MNDMRNDDTLLTKQVSAEINCRVDLLVELKQVIYTTNNLIPSEM